MKSWNSNLWQILIKDCTWKFYIFHANGILFRVFVKLFTLICKCFGYDFFYEIAKYTNAHAHRKLGHSKKTITTCFGNLFSVHRKCFLKVIGYLSHESRRGASSFWGICWSFDFIVWFNSLANRYNGVLSWPLAKLMPGILVLDAYDPDGLPAICIAMWCTTCGAGIL